VSKVEKRIANMFHVNHCLCVNSGGSALNIVLTALSLKNTDIVLMNDFTLSPVSGAIYSTGCKIIYTKVDKNLVIDVLNLENCIKEFKPRVAIVSHMRGYVSNMFTVNAICKKNNVILIEDCAHTFYQYYKGKLLGTFGDFGCFSLQSNKEINAGEGGVIITSNTYIFKRIVIHSGSYMFFESHFTKDERNTNDYELIYECANLSRRFCELNALFVLPQLNIQRILQTRRVYKHMCKYVKSLLNHPCITFPKTNFNHSYLSFLFYVNIDECKLSDLFRQFHLKKYNISWYGTKPNAFVSNNMQWKYESVAKEKNYNHHFENLFEFKISFNKRKMFDYCKYITSELNKIKYCII
jgi:dTDP-4-amino-4,6-dideoxygalactose transaminase